RSGNVLDYDPDSGQWVDTTDADAFTPQSVVRLIDPHDAGAYLAGERHIVWFDPENGRCLPVAPPGPHLAKAAEAIANGASGELALFKVGDSGTGVEAAITLTAHNWSLTKVWEGAPCQVQFHLQSRRWYLVASHAATLLRGKQVGALLATDKTNDLDDLVP